MLIGILSDTHGRIDAARRAISLLLDRGAEFLVHAGDVGDGVIELLPEGRAAFVFGNNDYDEVELKRLAQKCDIQCLGHGGVLTLGRKKIAVAHGDRPRIVNEFLTSDAKYLVTGHSHIAHDRWVGPVRWINPGALHRATPKSVATLDLATDDLQFHTLIGP